MDQHMLLPNARTTKRFNMTVGNANKAVDLYSNHLWTLIKLFPDAPWDTRDVISNKNTTCDLLINNPRFLDWKNMACCHNLTIEFIEANINMDWNLADLTVHKAVTIEFILAHPEIKWDKLSIPSNPNINEYYNKHDHVDLDVDPCELSMHLDLKHLLKHNINLDYSLLSCNRTLTWDYVLQKLNMPWNWYTLSLKHATPEILNAYPDLPWEWRYLSCNKNLTIEFIAKNINKPWDWTELSYSKVITQDFITSNIDKPWDHELLCYAANVDIEFIKRNPDIKWNWSYISSEPRFGCLFYLYPELPWDYKALSPNKNISLDIKLKNPNLHRYIALDHKLTWRIVVNADIEWNSNQLARFYIKN
jgi:hypothetical protein